MADAKITDLDELAVADVASGDLMEVVDTSDTTMAASGTNKKFDISQLLAKIGGTVTGTITSTIGTITANTPAFTATQTWNNAAVTFDAFKISVTSSASGNNSRVFSLVVGGVERVYLDKFSQFYVEGLLTGGVSGDRFALSSSWGLRLSNDRFVVWSSTNGQSGTLDTGLYRNAAGVVEVNNATAGTYRDLRARTLITEASTTSQASFKIPHGSAPTSPVDGDMWTTTAGLFVRINGSTVGPLS